MPTEVAMQIELYHLWDCPQSTRVRDFVERNSMRQYVRYVDVEDEFGAEERLAQTTGRVQMPCLVVDAEPIFGSANIIAWLKQYFLGDRPTPSLA
jgi:glutaredoxin